MLRMKKTWMVIISCIILITFLWNFSPSSFMIEQVRCSVKNTTEIQRQSRNAELKLGPDLKRLAQNLMEMQRSYILSIKDYNKIGLQIQIVMKMLKELNEDIELNDIVITDSKPNKVNYPQEVCPEEYKGKQLKYDYPFFRKGFGRVECKDFIPIEKLVTVLISMPEELPKISQTYLGTMGGVAKYFPKMQVILATNQYLQDSVKSSISKLNISFKNVVINKNDGESVLWQSLISKVTTPYVLIAPDITQFDDDINLERLLRILSYEPDVLIAGGSHRNLKGEWDMGCQQVIFRNWTAVYQGGYYKSFNECVVCDHISGPFMAKTTTLKDRIFDPKLRYGAFHDLFWRINQEKVGKMIVSCPDVMFNVRDRKVEDIDYVSFANKHEIHKIVETNGHVRWYGCRNGFSYTSANLCKKSKGMGLSPASMENLADAVKFMMTACEEAGAFCEVRSGTGIGAIKFNGVLPWEVDADIVFQTANFSVIKNLKDTFKKAKYDLNVGYAPSVKNGKLTGGYFSLRTTNWNIELWGFKAFESQMMVERGEIPTKVLFAGQWVKMARNPGLFFRNRYGAGTYKHQEHWRGIGSKTSWEFYNPGSYIKCPRPGHSACLDQFSADGNMQFRTYPQ